MPTTLSPKTLLPWLAALAVLLGAWFVRLPDPVLGKDQRIAAGMPETRRLVEDTRRIFLEAQKLYLDYVKSNNMTQLLLDIKAEIERIRATGGAASLPDTLLRVAPYLERLQQYASAGEPYFSALEQYDADMMAWTRSLGSISVTLRDDTFPMADHLRLYPPPIGDTPDPPYMTAAQVAEQTARFNVSLQRLRAAASVEEIRQALEEVGKEVDGVWEAGRSIERIESLHEPYYSYLAVYDATLQRKVSEVATGDVAAPTPIALLLNLLVGALVLAGVGTLFTSGWQKNAGDGVAQA